VRGELGAEDTRAARFERGVRTSPRRQPWRSPELLEER
jgi:hypothetical protein